MEYTDFQILHKALAYATGDDIVDNILFAEPGGLGCGRHGATSGYAPESGITCF